MPVDKCDGCPIRTRVVEEGDCLVCPSNMGKPIRDIDVDTVLFLRPASGGQVMLLAVLPKGAVELDDMKGLGEIWAGNIQIEGLRKFKAPDYTKGMTANQILCNLIDPKNLEEIQ